MFLFLGKLLPLFPFYVVSGPTLVSPPTHIFTIPYGCVAYSVCSLAYRSIRVVFMLSVCRSFRCMCTLAFLGCICIFWIVWVHLLHCLHISVFFLFLTIFFFIFLVEFIVSPILLKFYPLFLVNLSKAVWPFVLLCL